MVVIADLDEVLEPLSKPINGRFPYADLQHRTNQIDDGRAGQDCYMPGTRTNPNINGFSAALACYPIVTQLTSYLDLNSLHELSRTCRQFRANLLQFRSQLVKLTIRCVNETLAPGEISGPCLNGHVTHGSLRPIQRLTSGRVGACARDMVRDCRRCGRVVCRNCTIKPPSSLSLKNRHRRLCSTCVKAPLVELEHSSTPQFEPPSFTTSAFARDPCSCTEYVYLCVSCGNALGGADTTYKSVWTWRTRYSTYLGGLGTGIGEGNEGVKCVRGANCLAALESEVEIDCSVDGLSSRSRTPSDSSEKGGIAEEVAEADEKPGYLWQEIEGIGGVVKKKVKKRIRVGKTVKEYEDEREKSEYLGREIRRENRSWCGWCDRVVLGVDDLKGIT